MMIPVILSLCAMHFSLPAPPPAAWLQMYAQQTGCVPKIVPPSGNGTVLPARRINDFFPGTARYWPLIGARRADLVKATDQWLARGVTPGIVLPSATSQLTTKMLADLRALTQSGAAFVATASDDGHSFGGMATFYAAQGILINAVYLGRGYSPDLQTLPAGLYLLAPHWHHAKYLPLLPTQWADGRRRFVVLQTSQLQVGQPVSASDPTLPAGTAYTPELGQSWKFAGLDYKVDAYGEHSSALGWVVQSLVGLKAPLLRVDRTLSGNVIHAVVTGLVWFCIVVGLFSLLLLIFGLFKDITSHERS